MVGMKQIYIYIQTGMKQVYNPKWTVLPNESTIDNIK
jgi:hypothetical protein